MQGDAWLPQRMSGLHGRSPWESARVPRGSVRLAILSVLSGEPANGYQIIQRIVERSHGVWRPSPGSVYPTLKGLAREGLVSRIHEPGLGFSLTGAGQQYVDAHGADIAALWSRYAVSAGADDGCRELDRATALLWGAIQQIQESGDAAQRRAAAAAADSTRRALYLLLADDDS
jgi:DNA-binding PadR family transcriptional regulator